MGQPAWGLMEAKLKVKKTQSHSCSLTWDPQGFQESVGLSHLASWVTGARSPGKDERLLEGGQVWAAVYTLTFLVNRRGVGRRGDSGTELVQGT